MNAVSEKPQMIAEPTKALLSLQGPDEFKKFLDEVFKGWIVGEL
ncbi:MAG: hypothetical protein ACJART_002914 [Maribacter sp.]|jgi:hypothetical protein